MSKVESTKPKVDIRKRFLELAYAQLNPQLNSIDGLEQTLVNWYCFQYNVPPNDDKLLGMTVEELLVLRQMHNLRENPHLGEELRSDAGSYEEWLRKEMGEEYMSPEEMVAKAEEQEKKDKEEEEQLAKQLPDVVTTDFANPLVFDSEEDK